MSDRVPAADERTIWDHSVPADAGWAGLAVPADCCSERKSIPLEEFWARLEDERR